MSEIQDDPRWWLDRREREVLAQLMDIALLAGSVGDDATEGRVLAIVEGHLARAQANAGGASRAARTAA